MDVRLAAGLHLGLGMGARAIHDQGSGLGIEEVVAHAEAFGGAPGVERIVADFEIGVHRPRAGVELDRRAPGRRRSCVEPAGIAFAHGPGLPADGVDAVAAQVGAQPVALQQMQDPAELGVRLVAEFAGFEQRHLEAGVLQQLVNLARRVFAIVARVDFAWRPRPA